MRILFWFRKDLRLEDNTALDAAMRDAAGDVVPFYASDPGMLARDDIAATRVRFVLDSLTDLADAIRRAGSRLALDHGDPADVVPAAALAAGAGAVYWNDEYEPALIARDDAVERALRRAGIGVRRCHDRLLVAPGAVATAAGTPFTVYSAFRRACEQLPVAEPLAAPARLAAHDLPQRSLATLERLGFVTHAAHWPGGTRAAHRRLRRFAGGTGAQPGAGLATYATHRDEPAAHATSRLSADLKFGTLSPRQVVRNVRDAAAADARLGPSAEKFLSELRWRDFYAHVMFHFPHCEHEPFRARFRAVDWEDDPVLIAAWHEGRTGYPIVDAGMRELDRTGFMHNRVRMVVASFLTKTLLAHWRHGERHFMTRLVDGDLASNNGGWQWAASTGTDPQPYFRIFNPVLQGEKFDARGDYVKHWLPELDNVPDRWVHQPWAAPPAVLADARVTLGGTYPTPVVDLRERRERALAAFQAAAGS